MTNHPSLVAHGLDLSYFTGKLEAYLRAKGVACVPREMTTRSFRDCGRAMGFLPQVECRTVLPIVTKRGAMRDRAWHKA
jgi:hypothetical protein